MHTHRLIRKTHERSNDIQLIIMTLYPLADWQLMIKANQQIYRLPEVGRRKCCMTNDNKDIKQIANPF